MSINKTRVRQLGNTVKSFEGGNNYVITDPILRLKTVASSCYFGEPSYYVPKSDTVSKIGLADLTEDLGALLPYTLFGNNITTENMMLAAIDAALDYSIEDTLKLACYLRNESLIRVTPQVILVRASNHPKSKGTGLIRQYAPQIIKRGDEPATCLAYQLSAYSKKMPMSLKKSLKDILESFDDYTLSKYKMSNKEVKTVDVVNLTHAFSPSIDKLVKGTLSLEDKTWEAIISKEGSTKASWIKAIAVMPHMALLRNIRNFIQKNVPTEVWGPKLVATAKYGKQMPYRYWTAYKEVKNISSGDILDYIEQALDYIEQAMEISIGEMPIFKGKTLILTDISGSMNSTLTSDLGSTRICEVANLTALLIHRSSELADITLFNTKLRKYKARRKTSIFTGLELMNCMLSGGTENPITMALNNSLEHWDNIFVLSDMQVSNIFSPYLSTTKVIKEYRENVNSKVNVYFVQMAGYQNTLVPQYYDRTYILGGWNSNVIRFAHEMADMRN